MGESNKNEGRPDAMLTREEVAMRELGVTEISPSTAKLLAFAFLALIVSVPVLQHASEIAGGESPRVWDVFTRAPTERNFHEFERALEDDSVVGQWLLPRMQSLFVTVGVGNEQAYVDGDSLFFRPGVDFVTGPGFLDPEVLRRRALGGKSWDAPPQPDPLLAIEDFAAQLRARDIELVLLPTVVKPQTDPTNRFEYRPSGPLLAQSGPDHPSAVLLENPSSDAFFDRLRERGIRFVRGRMKSDWACLQTDTHWKPETMDRVASELAESLRDRLPARETLGLRRLEVDVSNHGDIATMLRLPDGQRRFPAEVVSTRRVVNADGASWRADPAADVLVLGDSFSNIYSLDGMGWGSGAGFVEALSFHLQRPVDRITINDAGAYKTRQALCDDLARGNDRLAGKRVVIWQFAMRELAVGDWRMLALPEVGAPASKRERALVKGRVARRGTPPRPGSVPYRDCLIELEMVDMEVLEGRVEDERILVYVLGMSDNVWTDAARWPADHTLEIELVPWELVEAEYGSYNRRGLDDLELELLDPWWGVPR